MSSSHKWGEGEYADSEGASCSMTPLEELDHENLIKMFTEKLENGLTAKLWELYFIITTLMKQLIQAERSGDRKLHLSTVKKLLPFSTQFDIIFYANLHRYIYKTCWILKLHYVKKSMRVLCKMGGLQPADPINFGVEFGPTWPLNRL